MTTKLIWQPWWPVTSISEAFRDPSICIIPGANMPLANGLRTSNLSVHTTVSSSTFDLLAILAMIAMLASFFHFPKPSFGSISFREFDELNQCIDLILRKDFETTCNCLSSSFPFSSSCKSGDLSLERQVLVRSRMAVMKFFKASTDGQEYVTNVTCRRALRMEIKHRKRYFQ